MNSEIETEMLREYAERDYQYGFVTDVETDSVPPGLNEEVIRFDIEHDAWVIGVCGRFHKQKGYWKAAIVDPMNGEVIEVIDGPVGKNCRSGPWPET